MPDISKLPAAYPHDGGHLDHIDFVCTSEVFDFDNELEIAALREMVERGLDEFDNAVSYAKRLLTNTRESLKINGLWPLREGQRLATRDMFSQRVRFRALSAHERMQHIHAHRKEEN